MRTPSEYTSTPV